MNAFGMLSRSVTFPHECLWYARSLARCRTDVRAVLALEELDVLFPELAVHQAVYEAIPRVQKCLSG